MRWGHGAYVEKVGALISKKVVFIYSYLWSCPTFSYTKQQDDSVVGPAYNAEHRLLHLVQQLFGRCGARCKKRKPEINRVSLVVLLQMAEVDKRGGGREAKSREGHMDDA